jgi:hypothetical protein
MRRLCSTGKSAWAGASSVYLTRCRGSRAARRTKRVGRTSPDWRIACCYVGKGRRRQGLASAALAGAVDLIAGLGGGAVEGYPEDAGAEPAGFSTTVLFRPTRSSGSSATARSATTVGS